MLIIFSGRIKLDILRKYFSKKIKLTIWNIDLEITKTIEKDLIKKYNFNRMLDDRFDINIAESEKKLFHIYKNKMLLL